VVIVVTWSSVIFFMNASLHFGSVVGSLSNFVQGLGFVGTALLLSIIYLNFFRNDRYIYDMGIKFNTVLALLTGSCG
jgi:hypothetical protein